MHSIITPLRGSFNYHEMSYTACSHMYVLVGRRGRSHFHGNGGEETFIVTIVVLKA